MLASFVCLILAPVSFFVPLHLEIRNNVKILSASYADFPAVPISTRLPAVGFGISVSFFSFFLLSSPGCPRRRPCVWGLFHTPFEPVLIQ
jgi:hypothetical protein